MNEIMETSNPASAQPSTCKCGVVIEMVGDDTFSMTPSECRKCDKETQKLKEEKRRQYLEREDTREAEREQARYDSVIPKLYRAALIDHLAPALQRTFAELDDGQGVYLWGPVGSGKTYALAALCRDFIDQRMRVKRVVWGRLLYRIRQTFSGHGDESEIITPLLTVNKLIIEDIGTSASMNKQENDFAVKTLLMILDTRIEDCLACFVTSNLSLENLAKTFDVRIASRIQQACVVIELRGKDRRKGAV